MIRPNHNPGLLFVLAAAAACGSEGGDRHPLPAALLWTQPADATTLFQPVDMKAGSRDVVWVADATTKVVLRLSPPRDEYLMFGYGDAEPVQLVDPWRLAVADEIGVLVYDRGTGAVDLYTGSGQHVRGFRLGFEPLAMYLTRQPYGLLYVMADSAAAGSSLLLVWSDLRGGARDTLVGPDAGPHPLRGLALKAGETFVGASGRGVWVWSAAASDTAYEVARRGFERRLVLRASDAPLQGLLPDPESDLLWLARQAGDSTRYEACDTSGSDDLDSGTCILGARTTPLDFAPTQVVGGALIGWLRRENASQSWQTAAYDLGAEALRRETGAGAVGRAP